MTVDADRDAAARATRRQRCGGSGMSRIHRFIAVPLIVGVALAAAPWGARAQADGTAVKEQAEKKVVQLCSACHGPYGISTSPEFPILAAQRRGYLETQLETLRDKSRAEKPAHDFMWGLAGGLDDATIDAIARYYAAQAPAPGKPGDPALIAKGKQVYETAQPDRYMPACATCHGADAQGVRDFPRLAGQHAKYIVKQLQFIQQATRKSPVMHGMVGDLTPADIDAVAAYVQAQ
jgi:cytochrome c553